MDHNWYPRKKISFAGKDQGLAHRSEMLSRDFTRIPGLQPILSGP
jgi:hypothetical protein